MVTFLLEYNCLQIIYMKKTFNKQLSLKFNRKIQKHAQIRYL